MHYQKVKESRRFVMGQDVEPEEYKNLHRVHECDGGCERVLERKDTYPWGFQYSKPRRQMLFMYNCSFCHTSLTVRLY